MKNKKLNVYVDCYNKSHGLLLKVEKYLIHLNICIQDKQRVLIQDRFQI